MGLAVPMSMPRYTSMESAERRSQPWRRASSWATAVLPEAVGPARMKADGLLEEAFADGLAEDGVAGDEAGAEGMEVCEEPEEAAGVGVLRNVGLDGG